MKRYGSKTTAADDPGRIGGFFPMPDIFQKDAPAMSEEVALTGEK